MCRKALSCRADWCYMAMLACKLTGSAADHRLMSLFFIGAITFAVIIILLNRYCVYATKAHAIVNDIQLNISCFSSFLNIVNDKDGSLRTGCRLFQATGPA